MPAWRKAGPRARARSPRIQHAPEIDESQRMRSKDDSRKLFKTSAATPSPRGRQLPEEPSGATLTNVNLREDEDSVKYEVTLSSDGEVLKTFESVRPFEHTEFKENVQTPPSESSENGILPEDVVLKFNTRINAPGNNDRTPRVTEVDLDTFLATNIRPTEMTIYSQPLLAAIRKIVSWYPSQALSGESITIVEPYPVLLHHIEELRETHSKLKNGQKDSVQVPGSPCDHSNDNDQTLQHLGVLLRCLEPIVAQHLPPILERLSRPNPVVTYDTLWYIYKPGIDVYRDISFNGSELTIGSVVAGFGKDSKRYWTDPSESELGTEVRLFSAESDGRDIGRVNLPYNDSVTFPRFNGEREVLSLRVVPCKYWDKTDGGARRRRFEERGNKYYSILYKQWKFARYTGFAYSYNKTLYEHASVIADIPMYLSYGTEEDLPGELDEEWPFYEGAKHDRDPFWKDYDNIKVKENASISPRLCFLLTPIIPCFVLKDKAWRYLDIEKLSEQEPKRNAMDGLVLDPGHEDLLMAVCDTEASAWKTDFVEKKGEGRIILLHGPPGVGKTYTVESIAETTGRPLISLTVADIGLDDTKIESNLVAWFKLAETWNAILLLDEADIFLEKRTLNEIHRNGLVSVFLRQLEYFTGLIFLTTNRTGQIDDAFVSRINTVIGYSRLDRKKRQDLWKKFFDKLARDMQEARALPDRTEPIVEINKYAKQYILNDNEVEDLQWNGREIRNALQTTISLAKYQASKDPSRNSQDSVDVEEEHFKSVVKMSKLFKDYMTNITRHDESSRARLRQERNDDFKSA